MTFANDAAMNLDELRRYVLTNRGDVDAFHSYVDRSKAAGRMITIDPRAISFCQRHSLAADVNG